jgi:anti-sigma B factor antagonist
MNFYVKEPEVLGKAMTITAGGELDMCAAPAIGDALEHAFEADVRTVVLDLADATFIDSTAIGTLIGASRRLRESGRRLLLSHCTNRNILRTFEIVGLEREIPVSRAPDASEPVVVVTTGAGA